MALQKATTLLHPRFTAHTFTNKPHMELQTLAHNPQTLPRQHFLYAKFPSTNTISSHLVHMLKIQAYTNFPSHGKAGNLAKSNA